MYVKGGKKSLDVESYPGKLIQVEISQHRYLVIFTKFLTCSIICFFRCVLFFFFLVIYIFFYLFMAALGLRCCGRAFSSCGERGLLFVAWASHCGGFSCCGAWSLGAWASVLVARRLQ